jgi:hypothetical protein
MSNQLMPTKEAQMTNIQTNLFTNPLQVLLTENTRNDDWVNATKWCQHFGTKFNDFRNANITFFRKLNNKLILDTTGLQPSQHKDFNSTRLVIESSEKGKSAIAWVHPILAIKLAEWLSPEFDIFVKETFKRYLDGDITLADDIVQRTNSKEDLKWLQKRLDGKIARKAFTDELKNHGVTGIGYAMNTNAIYKPILGKTAQELREERNIANGYLTRDNMSLLELSAIGLAEIASLARMQKSEAKGNKQTSQISEDTANKIKTAIIDIL